MRYEAEPLGWLERHAGMLPPLTFQTERTDGRTEAAAFQAAGYPAGSIGIGVRNPHNRGLHGRPEKPDRELLARAKAALERSLALKAHQPKIRKLLDATVKRLSE